MIDTTLGYDKLRMQHPRGYRSLCGHVDDSVPEETDGSTTVSRA
jgi:hypothetical protein